MTVWHLPAESRELVGPITVDVDSVTTSDFQVAIVAYGQRPTVWEDPTVIDDKAYILVGPGTSHVLEAGTYVIWVQVDDQSPEQPVIDDVGIVQIT